MSQPDKARLSWEEKEDRLRVLVVTCWGIHDNKASHAHLVLASRKDSHRIFQGLPYFGNAYTHHGYTFHYFDHKHVLQNSKETKTSQQVLNVL